ncbi:MAG: hypothetical protein IJY57_00465 [Clostridia bacterium]|nr:hypothetical protein [Clostridia bacterium]
MAYHINTGLIKEKFNSPCDCPLCEIKRVVEEQFLHEFLNDAVMETRSRGLVNEYGFCSKHFDMLYKRQNKLSLAVQISSRIFALGDIIKQESSIKGAKKQAEKLKKAQSTCIICKLSDESMEKYYKGIAKLYADEESFAIAFKSTKGFCLEHYSALLEHSINAGFKAKQFVKDLTNLQINSINRLTEDLNKYCQKHDYRNAYKPLGSAENVLPRTKLKLFGKDYE